jgi:hypothetical protein
MQAKDKDTVPGSEEDACAREQAAIKKGFWQAVDVADAVDIEMETGVADPTSDLDRPVK